MLPKKYIFTQSLLRWRNSCLVTAIGVLCHLGFSSSSVAQTSTVAQEPLVNLAVPVKPNVIFSFDNSGSMAWACIYKPHTILETATNGWGQTPTSGESSDCTSYIDFNSNNEIITVQFPNTINRRFSSSDHNALAYDPRKRYKPSFDSNGNARANAAAFGNNFNILLVRIGFNGITRASDLNTRALQENINNYHTVQVRTDNNFRLTTGSGAQGANTTVNPLGVILGGKPIKRTDCTANPSYCTAAEERVNIGNWNAYHRTRILAAKAGVGEAFANRTDNFRFSWTILSSTSTTFTLAIPAVREYSEGRTAFFGWLNGVGTNNPVGTPLRQTLMGVGEEFRKTTNAGPWGHTPWNAGIESASAHLGCRRNFSMMMTDGFYNDAAPINIDLDGTAAAAIPFEGAGSATPFAYDPTNQIDIRSQGKRDRSGTGFNGTLADVAFNYWVTDLRTDLANKITNGQPTQPPYWQNMSSYFFSFGNLGTMNATSVESAKQGLINWVQPVVNARSSVDDMVHAAHNSGGQFLTVEDADSFSSQVGKVLDAISGQANSTAGVAASAVTLTEGTRKFVPYYTNGSWWGNVQMVALNEKTGNEIGSVWNVISTNATGEPNGTTTFPSPSARQIYVWKNSTDGAVPFTWDSLVSNSLVGSAVTNGLLDPSFNQATQINTAVTPNTNNMINYLRGARNLELKNGGIFRDREAILGDIVNSTPVFLKGSYAVDYTKLPTGTAGKADFQAYLNDKNARTEGLLAVGANDGMLHFFRESNGAEEFAFVPRTVLQNLHNLTKPTYSHQYFVDGPLTEVDAYLTTKRLNASGTSTGWKNLIVGSTGAGSKAIFAMQFTTSNPRTSMNEKTVLWEKSDADGGDWANLGHVLTPIQTGLAMDGTWVAVFGNGYSSSNYNSGLFIVNLADGSLIKYIPASASGNSISSPNGLGGVRLVRNAAQQITGAYAGDMKGNLWKFDLSSTNTSGWVLGNGSAALHAARSITGDVQPITAAPAVFKRTDQPTYPNSYMVVIGTGKLISKADQSNLDFQSAYGLWDKQGFGNAALVSTISNRANLVTVTVSLTTSTVATTQSDATNYYSAVGARAMNWATDLGWVMDYNLSPGSGAGQRSIYSAERLGQLVRLDTIYPRQSTSDCDRSTSLGYNYLVDHLSGTCRSASSTIDIDGNGVIDENDGGSCVYSTQADGQDVVLYTGDATKGQRERLEDGGGDTPQLCTDDGSLVSVQDSNGSVKVQRTPKCPGCRDSDGIFASNNLSTCCSEVPKADLISLLSSAGLFDSAALENACGQPPSPTRRQWRQIFIKPL